jgi:hypothetical protein
LEMWLLVAILGSLFNCCSRITAATLLMLCASFLVQPCVLRKSKTKRNMMQEVRQKLGYRECFKRVREKL